MNITVKNLIRLPTEDNLKLVRSLLENRKPKEGSFDYVQFLQWQAMLITDVSNRTIII